MLRLSLSLLGVALLAFASCGGESEPDAVRTQPGKAADPEAGREARPEARPEAKDRPRRVEDPVASVVADLLGRFGAHEPQTKPQFQAYIRPLLRLSTKPELSKGEKRLIHSALGAVYSLYVMGPGEDDRRARAHLGHREYTHAIPDALTHRNIAFLRAVEWAARKRWFTPEESAEYALAELAWERTRDHVERLIHDPEYNAGDRVRASLGYHEGIDTTYLTARWARPYLICYVSAKPTSPFDALSVSDPVERRRLMQELEESPAAVEAVLQRNARVFLEIYEAYMRRYEKPLRLKPLMAPWGGRPDYPEGVRSYRRGAALVIWVFADRAQFEKHYRSVTRRALPWGVAAVFHPRPGHVYVCGGGPDSPDRDLEIMRIVHEGTHQLQFWFFGQRNRWRKPPLREGFFSEAFADYRGAVDLRADGTLHFHGLNAPHILAMRRLAKTAEKRGSSYPFFPIEKLVGFHLRSDIRSWGEATWRLRGDDVLGMFYRQSWALLYFLNHATDGAYRERLDKFHRLWMGGERDADAFREAFRLVDRDDWQQLDVAFQTYVKNLLLKPDPVPASPK